MNIDNCFHIGKDHTVCEDYSLSEKKDNYCYTIVCDGCSGSPHTDVGSRILTFAIKKELERINKNVRSLFYFNYDMMIERARIVSNTLDIKEECLDSTAIISYSIPEETKVDICGDGAIIVALKTGELIIFSVDYPSGYPFYLNYLPWDSKRQSYWENSYSKKDLKVTKINVDGTIEILCERVSPVFNYNDNRFHLGAREKLIGFEIIINDNYQDFIDYIITTSDGIKSFYYQKDTGTSKTNIPIDFHEVLFDLLPFKNTNGSFVKRRVNKFLKNCQEKGWHHYDDISFASISFRG